MEDFIKGQRIEIFKGGAKIDEATIEEVKGKTILTKCDKIPGEIIKFGYDKDGDCWYYLFEGLRGETCFSHLLPYTLQVA